MHLQPAAKYLQYKVGDFPVSEETCKNVISLPVHEFISKNDCDHMVTMIKKFYEDQ